ncbi:MAG: hypothetical protein GY906_15275 [bacterium]|nr:hypothetical protein [bacterium]
MGQTTQLVLFTGLDDVSCARMASAVRSRGIDVLQTPWSNDTIELCAKTRFDVVVAGYPIPAAQFGRFISALRAQHSACRRAGLILLTGPGALDDGLRLVGHGVNKVLSRNSSPVHLQQAIDDLLRIAPRVTVRASARIVPRREERGPHVALCQTVNVSRTGMLLRGWAHYPVGTRFDFQLHFPGEGDPIRGEALVARSTDMERERFDGFGARFLEFEEADEQRLDQFLTEELNSSQVH